MKIRIATALVLIIFAFGCGPGKREARDILDRLDSDSFDPPASTITAFRVALDINADVQQLVRWDFGAPVAHERLDSGVSAVSDKMAAICSYVIEKRNYRAAIPTLEAYLKSNPGVRHHVWGPTFAVRALVELKGIPDGSGGYDGYDDETIRKAIWGP